MKKKNAIMLADTRPALVGTVLLQLAKTNPGLFDEAIIYYTEPIDAKDRDLMESVLPCRFIEYRPPLPNELFEKPRFRLFSILMFCRYELPHYLNEFETVTWLDTDILIQGSLTGLIEAAKRKGAAFIREDPIHKTAENPDRMRTCFTEDLPGYQTDSYLYCSGTIVVSDKIKNFGDFTDWCYRKTVEWADILSLPDQGVLNAAIQEFSMDVAPISGKIYCCYPYMGRNCSGAKIIHAWGENKFWNDWYVYLHYPQWAEYYASWRSKGGSALPFEIKPRISVVIPSYKPNIDFMRECINSLMSQTRDGWERFSDFEIIIIAEPVEKEPLIQLADSFRDKRIHLIFNEKRLGIAASLNKGIRLAQGTYIARLDDDDVCAAPRLFLQSEYLNGHPDITLCTSDFEYFGDMNEWRLSFEGDMSFAWSIFTCPFDHPTIMFRRDFFVDNDLFYDEERGYVEDWELWRRAFAKGMTVGCIHRPLFFHRWIQAASAGQTNRTVEMMRELVQKNFAELGVEIPTEDLPLVGPWNGKLLEEESINRLEGYFTEALEQNRKEKIYDQVSLKKVFSLRLEEVRSGVLPGLSEKINQTVPHTPVEQAVPEKTYTQSATAQPKGAAYSKTGKMNWLKKIIIAIFKPLYRPFRHRYEDRILDIQQNVWINGGHHYDEIAKLDRISDRQDVQLERQQELWAETTRILREQQALLNCIMEEQQELHDVMEDLAEQQRVQGNMLSEMREEQVEQRNATNLVLSQQQTQQDMLLEASERRQDSSDRINRALEQQQNLWDRMAKIDNSFALVEKYINQAEWNLLYELDPNKMRERIGRSQTYDLSFYLNNRYGSILSAEKILRKIMSCIEPNSVVDFGCGTGTWLWVASSLGAKELCGLDGDYVPRNMLMIDAVNFHAADLEDKIELKTKYDLAISVEVAEHLHPEAADTFVWNLCNSSDAILFSAAHPGQGGDGHLNEQPLSYWTEKFAAHHYMLKEIRQMFENDQAIEWWYRDNIAMFIKDSRMDLIAKII